MKRKTYYKVVRLISENIGLSAIMVVSINPKFSLVYGINKTTIPNIGKIFVFDSLVNAQNFLDINKYYYKDLFIMEGHATNIGKPYYLSFYVNKADLEYFWGNKAHKRNLNNSTTRRVPEGTLSCSSFTPIRVVN